MDGKVYSALSRLPVERLHELSRALGQSTTFKRGAKTYAQSTLIGKLMGLGMLDPLVRERILAGCVLASELPAADVVTETLDANYYWKPPELDFVAGCVKDCENVLLVGPAGTGKSVLAEVACKEQDKTPLSMSMNVNTDDEDFLGQREIIAEGGISITQYFHGLLVQAMKTGQPLILDELDAATADILFTLHRALELRPIVLPKNRGEVIEPMGGFCVLGTANTVGYGDDSGMYAGTQFLNEAFRDRFTAVVNLWYIPAKAEVRVLQKRTGVAEKLATQLVQFANMARDAMKAGKLSCTLSTRKLLFTCGRVVAGVSLEQALEFCVFSKALDTDASALREMSQRALKSE